MIFVVAILALGAGAARAASPGIVIGSKKFTESVILGEIVADLARAAGAEVRHRRELGGTRVLWGALLGGDIDAYPEYTGTLTREILEGKHITTEDQLRKALAARGIVMGRPIGFNNTYAIGMNPKRANALGIKTISDLRAHPDLRLGLNNEFLDRADGWKGLKAFYNLPQADVTGLDHDLAYRGLAAGDVDATDVYTTDAEIPYYHLAVLDDDRHYFPVYDAVLLYRRDLVRRAPKAVAAFARLGGTIDAETMRAMNEKVKIERVPDVTVAAAFVAQKFGIAAAAHAETFWSRLARNTLDHLTLVAISLGAAIVVAVPLGILAARRRDVGQVVLGVTGVLQTIPSLALFVFMIPFLGIGGPPAIVALFLYSLLPIVRNTHAGLVGIAPSVRESAEALGLSAAERLRIVELPLAARSILAGIKTSAVINVGTATLGALIGAGGYGQPILTGIRLDDIGLILEGAVPAAALALIVQGLFELGERLVVPRGLRLRRA
jgi:osmoprotectant transport system substrate-binding protein/osmoprotectant transport system permease protein